jgi:radical SAM protein with 4Fe4S-binding SPASM domain
MSKADIHVRMIQKRMPRLPLEGGIDLTYRCNNNCRHCWVNRPDTAEERKRELTTEEWISLIDQARALGTREWAISGGEPLLREDFEALFAHINRKASFISLNTNGTLITPSLARSFKECDCHVMLSVYGATPEVHDRITRNPGSFDAAMRGISYLKEAGIQAMIQIVLMADNFHQSAEMIALAQSLSPTWRLGASHLILSASGDKAKNEEIQAQRLTPTQIISLNPPNAAYEDRYAGACGLNPAAERRTYGFCLAERNAFHIDPEGKLAFCCYIKEESLRFDLKKRNFIDGWDHFLPSLSGREQNGPVFNETCRTCEWKKDCQKCPGISHIEHRLAPGPSSYICQLTQEEHRYKQLWRIRHQRHFQIAGITLTVNSEREFKEDVFSPAVRHFRVKSPGDDVVHLELFFSLPRWNEKLLGDLVYDRAPWLIYRNGETWTYFGFIDHEGAKEIHRVAVFTDGHSHGRLFFDSDSRLLRLGLNSVSLLPTDQVWLPHVLLQRHAFYVHSCGLIVDGAGMLFVGHSRAGKSTVAKLFGDQAELLCDDRNIVRLWPGQGWRLHGTWSHGELSRVSASSAPLKAVFFLEKSAGNAVLPLRDPLEVRKRLIPCLPRTCADAEWWEGIWSLISKIIADVPAYILRFDKSGAAIPLIRGLVPDSIHKSQPGPGPAGTNG